SQREIAGSGVYSTDRFTEEELPPQVDLRPFMSPVEDQAGANSCTANAVVGGYEYIMNRLEQEVDFSRLFVYYNARRLALEYFGEDRIKDQGSSITLALLSLQDEGICHEETWSYEVTHDGKVKNVNTEPHGIAYNEAQGLLEFPEFQWEIPEQVPIDIYAMKHCLAEGYPFVFGLTLFRSFDRAKTQGRVILPDLDSEEGREEHGKHAMLCVGYKDSAEVFVVRNSWGEDWGDEGYCYIPYEYMTNSDLCFDCWKIKGTTELDLSEEIWVDEDEDFDDEFYDEDEEDDEDGTCYLTLLEAIAIIALYGAAVDGLSEEETELLVTLYDRYDIDAEELQEKIDELLEMGGFEMLYNAATQVILAEDCAEEAFQVSAEFAIADEHFSEEEYQYWSKLAGDLELDGDRATEIFNRILEEYDMEPFEDLF
ncbi:C1 family peptidase, partial [Spirulina sp. 06S082]|uniref:C1 family peptidase n=1 Tax=Spirulina sp. 06S082 TaxID=3110248 RepID=UPI002B20BC1F